MARGRVRTFRLHCDRVRHRTASFSLAVYAYLFVSDAPNTPPPSSSSTANVSILISMNSRSSVSALLLLVLPDLVLLDSTDGPSFWGEVGGSNPLSSVSCPSSTMRPRKCCAHEPARYASSWIRPYPFSAARRVCSVLCMLSGSAGDDWSAVCDKGRGTGGKPRESNANRLRVSFCRRRLFLDELQSTPSSASVSMEFAVGTTTRTLNVPRASLQ